MENPFGQVVDLIFGRTRSSTPVRHPRQSRWLAEWDRLQGGRPLRGARASKPRDNRPWSSACSWARLEARPGASAPPPVETAEPRAQQCAPVQWRSRPLNWRALVSALFPVRTPLTDAPADGGGLAIHSCPCSGLTGPARRRPAWGRVTACKRGPQAGRLGPNTACRRRVGPQPPCSWPGQRACARLCEVSARGAPAACSQHATGGALASRIAPSCARPPGQTSGVPQILSYFPVSAITDRLYARNQLEVCTTLHWAVMNRFAPTERRA